MLRLLRRVWPSWSRARPLLIISTLLVFIAFFLFWRLGSMTSGLGPNEYESRQNAQNVGQIIDRGINAPYYLLQHGLQVLLSNDVLALRLASVTAGLIILVFLFWLLRGWFGKVVALFATLVFIATPWVIITIRTATPDIMLLAPIVPLTCFVLMIRSKQRAGSWWLLLCLSAAISLYTPGLIWLLLAGVLVTGMIFSNISSRVNSLYVVGGLAVALLTIIPLVLAISLEPARFKQLVLVPDTWQPGVEVLKSIGWSAASFVWSTRDHVDIGVGRLPILNILQIVLFVFGFYALSSRARNIIFTLSGMLLFSIFIASINNNPHLLLFGLPAVAIFMAAGLRYLYIEWRHVFPLNPFAYGLAVGLIALVAGTHLLYSARYSLIAWPKTAETKANYVLK